jgi:hypothetical protein
MRLNPAVIQLIEEIPDSYQKWVIVDYPKTWIERAHHTGEITEQFPEDRRILASSLKAKHFGPEFFSAIASQAGLQLSDCLLVDADSARAVAAIRHGLASIIYVYPEHLKHELALQGIIQTDTEVLHPSSSERVEI